MNKRISSSDNKEIKHLIKLVNKPRLRKESKSFVVEGKREISRAYQSGYKLVSVYYRENYSGNYEWDKKTPSFEVKKKLFDKITIRSGSEKMIALVSTKELKLDQLILTKKARVLVIESPEKPGNICGGTRVGGHRPCAGAAGIRI